MKGAHIINIPNTVGIGTIRKDAVKIAKEIGYPQKVVDAIWVAQNQTQINNILAGARHEWDVKPGRVYKDKNGKPSSNCDNALNSEDMICLTITEEPEYN